MGRKDSVVFWPQCGVCTESDQEKQNQNWLEQSTGKEIPPIMGTRVEIASRIAAALTSGLASGTILHKKMDYGDIYQKNI